MTNPTMPLISIVTPSFNQAQFIRETIDSVLNQNYPNLEYWVIDGGSTDGTVEILKSYGSAIHWVSEKDEGQTDAINKGFRKCHGEILAYINSDDVYLPNTFQTVAEYFTQHPDAQWLTGDYFIIDEHGNKVQSYVAWYKRFLRQYPQLTTLAIANYVAQPSTFWRKSAAKKIGNFNQKLHYCMDFEFWLRMIKEYPLAVSSRHFSLFRIHGQSKGGAAYRAQFKEEHQVVLQQTSQVWIRVLHWIHAFLIILAYDKIKK